ncbi:MAG: FAD-dependent oxidoreductase [Bacteroidia bacterium]
MKLPILFCIDDDAQVLRAVTRDLKTKFRKEYRVMSTDSAKEGLESLAELRNKGETVALFLSDQKMPEMNGVDFLEKAKEYFPQAKRVLLTAYSDTDAAIKAINEVQLDYYLMKPWDPPEEKLYPVINDLLEEWQSTVIPEFAGIRIVGYQFSSKSHKIKEFLSGNLIAYKWLDITTSENGRELMELNKLDNSRLPVVFFEDGTYVCDPDIQNVASKVGLNVTASSTLYDVVIVGAGPSGLAAAVYGASEGLKTLIIEKHAPGGQAGTSSRIENYLGFPAGLSGSDLARRAVTQATRFGTEFLSPQEVARIETKDQYKILHFVDGSSVTAKSIVITTGVSYRKLETDGLEKYTGAGVYYGAANTEAHACKEQDVFIVGGGNSAGQAAMYLSQFARKVRIIIRREDLKSSMSSYLIDQINGTPNIEVLGGTEIAGAEGNEKLEKIKILFRDSGEVQTFGATALFIFIGTKPFTEWTPELILKDEKGFLQTGRDLMLNESFKRNWKSPREPYLLETSIPGIFAAGDARSGAMNRVASAVGEGAMAISFVHRYLEEI